MTRSKRLMISLFAALPWLLILLHLLVIVPRFMKMFQEYGLKLPVMTQLVINLSHLVRSQLIPACAILFLLVAAWWGVADAICRKETQPGWRSIALLILYSIPVGIFVLCWLGVGLPYNQLQDGLRR
jgi:type II secretory pathway component PulF